MNLSHLYFDIVSDLELRISDFTGLGISTLVESALQIHLFLQNKANFRKRQMYKNTVITMNYEQLTMNNEPIKTNPIKANFEGKKMLLPGQSARRPSCGNGCKDKNCNSLIDLALH